MPHIHVEYSGMELVVALDGAILEGDSKFPKNKLKLLDAWMEIHREDLEANWTLLSNGEQFFRIDPLREPYAATEIEERRADGCLQAQAGL